jgi:hypothetical protein
MPHVDIVTPGASPEEAAAVVAAIEQFLRDHAPVVSHEEPAVPAWHRAALLEGVGLRSDADHPWL